MIAVDTNVLVYAHREEMAEHPAALAALNELVATGRPWAVPWPCVHEFLAVVTNRRHWPRPSGPTVALAAIEALAQTEAVFLAETSQHLSVLSELMATPGVVGGHIHDARIAAICLGHGVTELWTADRDFGRFPTLRTRNPLVGR